MINHPPARPKTWRHRLPTIMGILLLLGMGWNLAASAQSITPIERRIPPRGIEISTAARKQLQSRLDSLAAKLESSRDATMYAADAEVYLKAVELALKHNEFFDSKDPRRDILKASRALDHGAERISQLRDNKTPWRESRGLVVRGYQSSIDGSAQPYGLVIPEELDLSRPAPLYIWLHGRGDKVTDLHFIDQRENKLGNVAPDDAIVLHPFGRQCIGYKSAGEIDVLDAVEHVKSEYNIDEQRIVLMGFSMGGAGVWHIGAHYPDRWVAMSPGAGFAETAQYNRLTPKDYPPTYERTLWGAYDVPDYTLNLFNLPVIVYSGELDKQIQAARVMESAYQSHGRTLPHIIGPGMGHKYHPDSLAELLQRIEKIRKQGQDQRPQMVTLQTKTLRYPKVHWVEALRLNEHWRNSVIEAEMLDKTQPTKLKVATENIRRLRLSPGGDLSGGSIEIDGQALAIPNDSSPASQAAKAGKVTLIREANKWDFDLNLSPPSIVKSPGRQGPIDDAFMAPFLVVLPSGSSKNPKIEKWVQFELTHFLDRWEALFRGKARVKLDVDVTREDAEKYNLILWGDPDSNRWISNVIDELPVQWNASQLVVRGEAFDSKTHLPLMIYPNPANQQRYVVLNSGPTFREGHDRTNSLQNPKLPDWAVIDVRQQPNDTSPGKVVATDFFDETWKFQ